MRSSEGFPDIGLGRNTGWMRVSGNPDIQMRLWRPPLHRPLDCPKYDMIRGHENYQFDGACRNFKPTEQYCVFCNACPMSAAFLGVPFDPRFEYDKAMGW